MSLKNYSNKTNKNINILNNSFSQESGRENFSFLQISIASPEAIKSWSYGEIKKSDTINYRTMKPERSGLFCAKIFGPVNDYECSCGKYKRMKHRGVICEKCGVEVTSSFVRRRRMGHINLNYPVTHTCFFRSQPSRISYLLNLNQKDLERVIYFDSDIVIDGGLSNLETGQLISPNETQEIMSKEKQKGLLIGSGSEAIRIMLSQLDLEYEQIKEMEALQQCKSEIKKSKIEKRLNIINAFKNSINKPEHMILTVLPVLAPDLRPLVPLEGGRFASSDLNELYRRIINRNNRLKRLINLYAPDIILRNEKRLLQDAVDSLFDNTKTNKIIIGVNKQPLKSLTESLKGKQGLFRHNLLGKRVDYSGRSAITVGPNLAYDQCGLPREMAIELFKPFLYSYLIKEQYVSNLKLARQFVNERKPIVWDLLEKIIQDHPILLNRAPTLHRLSIQAFYPKLINGKAIELHPLLCSAFNADFDGDSMSVHVPISIEAQMEARILMLSSNNINSPSTGLSTIGMSQDIVLGLYGCTTIRKGSQGDGYLYSSVIDVVIDYKKRKVDLNAPITCIVNEEKEETSIGRVILYNIVKEYLPFELVNTELTKKNIMKLITYSSQHHSNNETVQLADLLMKTGFMFSTLLGESFGLEDILIPQGKISSLKKAEDYIKNLSENYNNGLITKEELDYRSIEIWSEISEDISQMIIKSMEEFDAESIKPNSLYTMYKSGARGSIAQIKQLAGIRGLMVKQDGSIIKTPVKSNFKEGMDSISYFNSTHGARKGLSDTALRTSNAGYMFRKLADSSQDLVITSKDCGTKDGLYCQSLVKDQSILISLEDQIIGRVNAEDIMIDNQIIIPRNTLINKSTTQLLNEHEIRKIKIRSPVTCNNINGICSLCYGSNLSNNMIATIGDPVGIIAAQSIGEPGTQLTMRTFHKGGISSYEGSKSELIAQHTGKVKIEGINICKNSLDHYVAISEGNLKIIQNNEVQERYLIPLGAVMYVVDGQEVKKDDTLSIWDSYNILTVSSNEGTVQFIDLIKDFNLITHIDHLTGISYFSVKAKENLKPTIKILTDNQKSFSYQVIPGSTIYVQDQSYIKSGDLISTLPKSEAISEDIISGLNLITQIFEAYVPKHSAIIADMDGTVNIISGDSKQIISLISDTGEKKNIHVPYSRVINVQDGSRVKKRDILVAGPTNMHDILRIFGVNYLAEYILEAIQTSYSTQGVTVNNRHIETIIHNMINKVKITKSNHPQFIVDTIESFRKVKQYNESLEEKEQDQLIKYEPILQGIKKASLSTSSFLSSASFQETIKVLTEFASKSSIDRLVGLKENVLLGRRIPSGTGFSIYKEEINKINKIKSSINLKSLIENNDDYEAN
jgi:DNA-directed RNA polymerase subunit beta'